MFNPSFCQELSNKQPARRHPNFPSGTHDILVGDKRGARRGQTRPSWGTNERLVGAKDNRLSVNRLQRRLIRRDERHKKGGLYDILETSKASYQRPVVSPQRHRGRTC